MRKPSSPLISIRSAVSQRMRAISLFSKRPRKYCTAGSGRHDVGGVKHGDFGEALKVARVESEDLGDPVGEHRGHDPGVVDLNSGNRVNDYEPSPLRMDAASIGKKCELALQLTGTFVGLQDSQADAVSFSRPGADVPEFHQ